MSDEDCCLGTEKRRFSGKILLSVAIVSIVLLLSSWQQRPCLYTVILTAQQQGSPKTFRKNGGGVDGDLHRALADVRPAVNRHAGDTTSIPPLTANDLSNGEHSTLQTPQAQVSTSIRHNSNFVAQSQHNREKQLAITNNRTLSAISGDTGKLSKEQCKAKYGERRYLPIEQKKFPPMLYTFPGSGNTWCRLLIEYGTGIYSGSVYNDGTLLHSLPGEFTCNWQVSVIKIHQHTHPFEGLRTGVFNSDANKCKRGGVDKIRRAVLLIRDPYDSIWSEFQRRITQSHVGGVLKQNFNWPRWQANAAALAHQYNLMWAVHHAGIEEHFAAKDILYLKYEDLKNKATRVDTLLKVAQFLAISTSSREQLECAFLLADNRETHRTVDPALTMSKEEAYTHPLACRMWALFGTHAAKHGYKVWRNYDCSKNFTGPGTPVPIDASGTSSGGNIYPPIPRVNVGPQGEYDRKWVKPGAPLLDFGGHPTSKGVAAPEGGGNTYGKPNVHPHRPGGGGGVGPGGKKGPGGAQQKKVPGNKPQKPGTTVRPRPESMRAGAYADAGGSGVDAAAPPAPHAPANVAGGSSQASNTGKAAPAAPAAPPAVPAAGVPKFRLVTPIPTADALSEAAGSTAPAGSGLLSGALASASDIASAIARTFQQTSAAAAVAMNSPATPTPAGAGAGGGQAPAVAAASVGVANANEPGSPLQQLPDGGAGGMAGLGGLGLGKKGRGGKKKAFGPMSALSGKRKAGRAPLEGVAPMGMDIDTSVGGDGAIDATATQQQQRPAQGADGPGAGMKKDKLRGGGRGGKMRTQGVTGMSLEQASQKDAVIAAVGADKPAWQ